LRLIHDVVDADFDGNADLGLPPGDLVNSIDLSEGLDVALQQVGVLSFGQWTYMQKLLPVIVSRFAAVIALHD
jgi:hypothetical protein